MRLGIESRILVPAFQRRTTTCRADANSLWARYSTRRFAHLMSTGGRFTWTTWLSDRP